MLQNTIEYRIGSLLDVPEGHIIHGCNAQGVMGSGVALAVKTKYPLAYVAYQQHLKSFDDDGIAVGTNSYWKNPSTNLVIWNAVTQERYGAGPARYVSYDGIEGCLRRFQRWLARAGTPGWDKEVITPDLVGIPKVLNFPRIGCGLGGGDWNIIEAIIENTVDPSIKLICWDLPAPVRL